jgi:hypothetical protein
VAALTVGIRKELRSWAAEIPAPILKALPQDELLDRLAHAQDLATRTRDPQLAKGYVVLAKAMLAARPRDAVAKEIARCALQARRTRDPAQAATWRRAAAQLTERNPPAPARAEVAKARAGTARESGLHGVWTAKGALVGVIDQSDLQPVLTPEEQAANRFPVSAGGTTGLGKPRTGSPQQPLPGDMPGRIVVKAGAKSGSGDQVAVYNQAGDLVGICDPGDITPLTEPKVSVGNPQSMTPQPPAEAGTPAGVAKAAARARAARPALVAKSTFTSASTAGEQASAFNQLNAEAILALAGIRGRGPQGKPRQ